MLKALGGLTRRRSSRGASAEQEHHLCLSCENLDVRSLLDYGTDLRRSSVSQSLPFSDVKSQRKSCGLCSLILDAAETVLESNKEHYVDYKIVNIRTRSHAKHQLKVSVSGHYRLPLDLKGRVGEAYNQESFTEHFYLQELPPGLLADDESNQLVDERPIDFSQVKRWLSTCHHDHGVDCDPATKYGFVRRPKDLTVVDVENRCLVVLPANAHYAALSYVWGGVQLVHLNNLNKNDLKKPGGLSSHQYASGIPATIWDALEVTKEIGLRHLWIDSLCIQQDDPVETKHQVTHMHNIFGSAYVTLVAAHGDSAGSGLLGTSFRPRGVSYGLKLIDNEDERSISRLLGPGMLLTLVALHHDGPLHPDYWDINQKAALPEFTDVYKTVWNSRAWTYQESQLSSRALVFLDGQVFWHCNQAVFSEQLLGRKTNSRGHGIDKRYSRLGNLTSNVHFRNSWKQHDASIEVRRDGRTMVVSSEAFLLYKDLVTAYTPRNMGNVYDKLAAFDGIGKVLERCLNSELIYGLPESLLDLALLWHPKTTLSKVSGPRFPSWSWAGWKGAVEYPEQHGVSKGARRDLHEDESRPERLRPLNRWYRATEEGLFEPINTYGVGIKEALQTGNLPDGWKGFLAPSESRNIDIDAKAPSPALLRCYAMKANLSVGRNKIYSSDGHDRTIGEFAWDECEAELQTLTTTISRSSGTSEKKSTEEKVDFIALSETQFFKSEEMNKTLRGNLYAEAHEYKLYHIMAVQWSDTSGTAYRRGLGRVFQDEWEKGGVEYRWVNLG